MKNNRKEEELDNLFEKENEVYRDKLEKECSYQYNNYQQYFVLYFEKAFNPSLHPPWENPDYGPSQFPYCNLFGNFFEELTISQIKDWFSNNINYLKVYMTIDQPIKKS